jgi:hypothetical protein
MNQTTAKILALICVCWPFALVAAGFLQFFIYENKRHAGREVASFIACSGLFCWGIYHIATHMFL